MYTQPPRPDMNFGRPAIAQPAERRPNWWLRLTSAPALAGDTSFEGRERLRRSRLASWLILGILVSLLLVIPVIAGSAATAITLLAALVGLLIAAVCNRLGLVTLSGIILILLFDGGIFASIASEPHGITMFDLPGYDALTITVVVAASILPPVSAFLVAALNALLIVVDFSLQPHAADLTTNIQLYGAAGILARPLALLVIVAIVGYLWVRGTNREVHRADRAEGVAALEHAYAEQRRQLEIGVQQILATHVRLANGDYNARAPLTQENILWQIASSLNNLIVRLKTSMEQAAQSGRAAYQLRRTEDEAQRLAAALRDLQAGRQPIWPQPTGTVVDELLSIVANRPQRPSALGPASMYGSGNSPRTDPQSQQGWPPAQSGVSGMDIPSWFTPSGERPGNSPQTGQGGWASTGQGRTPNIGGQGQPFGPADPSAGSADVFANGWPSLNTSDSQYQNMRDGTPSRGASDEFPPLSNPWYLPPDE
ncbi:MAG: hypothetical protein ACLQUY_08470 [Ktedonobacterales bacterium]